jgi:hypothetical protein
MTRVLIMLICGMLIITSLISLNLHDTEIAYVIGLSKLWVIGRLALAGFLAAYYLFFPLRQPNTAFCLRIIGVGLLYIGLTSMLWGSRASGIFVPVTDIVLTIESGIVAILASIELPRSDRAALDLISLKLTVLKAMGQGKTNKLNPAAS